jgi:hypothetical protein
MGANNHAVEVALNPFLLLFNFAAVINVLEKDYSEGSRNVCM